MWFALQPRFYAHVPVWLWPWVLLQILAIMAWSEESGRTVLFTIRADGRLRVDHVGDDPRLWTPAALHALRPVRHHWHACDPAQSYDPARTGDDSVYVQWLRALINWTRPSLRGGLKQAVLRPDPAVQDSS